MEYRADDLALIRGMGFSAERKRPCVCPSGFTYCQSGCAAREHVLHGDPDRLVALSDQRRAFASRMRAINGGYAA